MARKSRWAQFTDNFNGVYGTFNKIGKDIESTKVMNNEYEDDKGNALGGDALDRRRMQELSKVYTKYGDTKGGLDLRAQQAKIESDKRANDLSRDTYDELVKQNGLLKTQQMLADRRGTDANTANTQSTTARRDALLPGEVDQQGATLDNTDASTANTQSTTARRDALLPGEIVGQGLDNTGKELNNKGSAIDVDIKDATSASTIESTVEGNNAKTADSKFKNLTSTLALEDLTREESLLTSIMGDDSYNTPEEAQTAYRAAIENDDTIPFERKNQILGAIDKMGLEKLTAESAKLAKGAQSALQTGGMDGLVKYYDTIDDGDTMRIERNDDGTVSIIAARGDEETVLFSDNSEDAETIVTQQMYNQISRPGTGMEVAAAALDMEKTRSETSKNQSQVGLIDKQAFGALIQQDVDKARVNLIESQTAQIDLAIEQSKSGLTGRAKIAEEGLADLLKKDQYILLAEDEPAAAAQLIGDFMQRYQMKGAPPAGVDAQSWFALSEAEQQEYIEAGQ